MLGPDLAAVAQDRAALEAVLQLAHVARPGVLRRAPSRAASVRRRPRRPISRAYFSRKASARRRMSPRRRRRGGISTGKTERRKKRSSRNCFAATASLRSRLVAATTRTSTLRVCTPPTRSNCFSWTRRRILPCRSRGRSPISSRNSVPWWAISALPTLRPVAPVNAPFSWPKSSFSSRASGMAAQLMATKGPLARAESWWSERAISSLPVPLSPRRSTVASVAAARWRAIMASFRAASSPMSRGQPDAPLVVLLEQHVFGEEAAPLQGALEQEHEVLGVDGLGQEVGRALLHRAHRVVDRRVGGHDDDGHVGVGLLGRLQDLEPAPRRQLQVGEHDEHARGLQPPARLVGVARLVDGEAARLERLAEHAAQGLLVLDDEDVRHGRRIGDGRVYRSRSQPDGMPFRRASSSRSAQRLARGLEGGLRALEVGLGLRDLGLARLLAVWIHEVGRTAVVAQLGDAALQLEDRLLAAGDGGAQGSRAPAEDPLILFRLPGCGLRRGVGRGKRGRLGQGGDGAAAGAGGTRGGDDGRRGLRREVLVRENVAGSLRRFRGGCGRLRGRTGLGLRLLLGPR